MGYGDRTDYPNLQHEQAGLDVGDEGKLPLVGVLESGAPKADCYVTGLSLKFGNLDPSPPAWIVAAESMKVDASSVEAGFYVQAPAPDAETNGDYLEIERLTLYGRGTGFASGKLFGVAAGTGLLSVDTRDAGLLPDRTFAAVNSIDAWAKLGGTKITASATVEILEWDLRAAFGRPLLLPPGCYFGVRHKINLSGLTELSGTITYRRPGIVDDNSRATG